MLKRLNLSALVGLLIFAAGCATKTVVIDRQADVVRLGDDVSGSVYVMRGGIWVLTGRVNLPQGWYAGPGPVE